MNDIFSPTAAAQLLEDAGKSAFRKAISFIETADDLQTFLTELFITRDVDDFSVEVDGDNESLTIDIEGVGINDDGFITNPVRDFEVTVEVTLSRTFQVQAFSRESAEQEFEWGGDRYDEVTDFGWDWSVERTEVEAEPA